MTLTSLTYPGGSNSVSRGYDDAGRLTSVGDWLGHTNTFKYDSDSNLCTVQYGNGVVGSRAYDRADRLSNGTSPAMTYYASGTVSGCSVSSPGATLLSLTYPRDALGQVSSETCTSSASAACPSGGSTSYGYDPYERLNSSAGSSYTMDAADRLTGAPLPGGVSQSLNDDAAGELTTSTAGSASYTYGYNDPSGNHTGNRTSRTDQLGTKLSYSYDQLNRLTGFNATRPNSWLPVRNYTYGVNGDGLRMSKAIDGVGNGGYAWDVAEGLPLLLQDGSTAYITGPGGLPMEQVTGSTVDYYQPDQLGSTRLVTDGSAQISDAYTYDPYGNLISSQVGVANPFMFAGQYSDQQSGLYYLRARYYDPATGQFIGRDPLVSSTREAYAYALDNPPNGVDPSGLKCCDWFKFALGIWEGADATAVSIGGIALIGFGWGLEPPSLGASTLLVISGGAIVSLGGGSLYRVSGEELSESGCFDWAPGFGRALMWPLRHNDPPPHDDVNWHGWVDPSPSPSPQ